MSRYGQRWVALRLAYVGTRYSGMQYAESVETVEGALFDALTRTKLITSKDDCGFSRGGRTDRGVSALGQVVALRLRSSVVPPPVTSPAAGACSNGAGGATLPAGGQAASALAETALAESPDASMDVSGRIPSNASTAPPAAPVLPPVAGEMDYVRVLNRVLPADIRVISWAPVPPDWSARFSASSRTYHYFFARSHYRLDAMREGARRLVGAHDFRNFCKLDPAVNSFERAIHSFEIQPVDGMRVRDGGIGVDAAAATDGGDLGAESVLAPWVFVINGSAFLWHQARCHPADVPRRPTTRHPIQLNSLTPGIASR
jgi:tRNA pseudouridine38/39 synthase